jgi:alpha-L-rhamnosidase
MSKWIGMGKEYRSGWAMMLRREFRLPVVPKKAQVRVCGLGYYELYLNGRRVGDHVLDPAQTDYQQRVFYVSHDVTKHLRHGINTVGIILGDGWYHQSRVWDQRGMAGGNGIYGTPRAFLELRVDGRSVLATDRHWKADFSPITLNNVYAGESYDARLEQPGWDCPGFDDRSWRAATVLPAPGGALEPQPLPPIKRMRQIPAVKFSEPRSGVFVFDFGEMLAGWTRLSVKGHPGQEISLRFSEALDGHGMLQQKSCGADYLRVLPTDRYIIRGNRRETWEPRFTYRGFRYVEVTGLPESPRLGTVTAIKVHTALPEVGQFKCSLPALNTLHEVIKRTITCNLHGVPTDCPTREKCGWTGDAWVIAEAVMFNWDAAAFWRKFVDDIRTSRQAYGDWMMVVPGRRHCLKAAPAWGSAQVEIPWLLYQSTGDRSVLKENYPLMKAWVEHLEVLAGDPAAQRPFDLYGQVKAPPWPRRKHILTCGLDDWAPPRHMAVAGLTVPQISTACFFMCAKRLAATAGVLGQKKDAVRFGALAAAIGRAFHEVFYHPRRHTYGSQSVDAFALHLGLVPDGLEGKVASALAADIQANDWHMRVGHIGARFVFQALSENGHENVIRRILETDTYPGFSHMLGQGATTLWELWEGEGGSLNHPFKGGCEAWLFSHVLGIRPGVPGFREIIIQPGLTGVLTSASGYYDSIRGRIAVSWTRRKSLFRLNVEIPDGAMARVRLPASPPVIHSVGSGQHEFQTPCYVEPT